MNEVPANIVKKIQTLAQIAADLGEGKDYNITRLTMLKSLCSDPEAAAKFAVHRLPDPGRCKRFWMRASEQRTYRWTRKAVRRMKTEIKGQVQSG